MSCTANSNRKWLRLVSGPALCWTLPVAALAQAPAAPLVIAPAASPAPFPMAPAAPLETRFFPLSEVRRGLRGVAYTVFEGVTPEPMEVEILGLLKNALGPGQDMILARLHGARPEYTGVVAGMSGSPVYVDGRLVGALSYRIGQFSKEPIAGITPIDQMLEVREGQDQGTNPGAQKLDPTPVASGLRDNTRPDASREVQAIETPLVFSGFSQQTIDLFGDRFRALGMTPVVGLGGAADPAERQPEPIVPGSAVSAVLARGDMSMAGTCTVTYVDPRQLMACGHPLTQYGRVQMPMTKANVVATLSSPLNAFKIVNTTETVGAFTEDRASAILGHFGQQARMIPVEVNVAPHAPEAHPAEMLRTGTPAEHPAAHAAHHPARPDTLSAPAPPPRSRSFHYEVLDNRQMTPSVMLVSVYQSLQGTNGSAAEMSYRLQGQLSLTGARGEELPPVRLEAVLAPTDINPSAINAALFVNDRFSRVYGNMLEQPVITGLHLNVEALPERRTAVLEAARLSRTEARAGDTLELEATIRPYQAASRVLRIPIRLPDSLESGPLRVVVSDGATLDRLTMPSGMPAQHAAGLADTVAQLNRTHPNDRVFCALLNHAAQAVLESGALPGVPLSMANVFEPLRDSQKAQLSGESVLEAGSSESTGYALTGSVVLTLMVR